MSLSIMCRVTLETRIDARLITNGFGALQPSRRTWIRIFVPRGPRIIFTASSRFMSAVDLQLFSVPSGHTATIWSFALMTAARGARGSALRTAAASRVRGVLMDAFLDFGSPGEPEQRIDGLSVVTDLKVKPGSRRRSSLPNGSDRLPAPDTVAGSDMHFVQIA